jgi:hypothetical protein
VLVPAAPIRRRRPVRGRGRRPRGPRWAARARPRTGFSASARPRWGCDSSARSSRSTTTPGGSVPGVASLHASSSSVVRSPCATYSQISAAKLASAGLKPRIPLGACQAGHPHSRHRRRGTRIGARRRTPQARTASGSGHCASTHPRVLGRIAHVGLYVGAVVHNYETELFLPPH